MLEETKTYGSKGFQKRLMVVETEAKYGNLIAVEAAGKRSDLFDGFSVGEEVTVSVNVSGREHNGRYFVSLEAWKIQLEGGKASNSPQDGRSGGEAGNVSGDAREGADGDSGEFDGDIPF